MRVLAPGDILQAQGVHCPYIPSNRVVEDFQGLARGVWGVFGYT
jgi:hypothetical protein